MYSLVNIPLTKIYGLFSIIITFLGSFHYATITTFDISPKPKMSRTNGRIALFGIG